MDKKTKIKKRIKDIAGYIIAIVLGMVIPLLFVGNVAFIAYIPSESMCNTLQVKDRICVSKLAYNNNEPKTGDIIVFNSDQIDNEPIVLIKRVIGCPDDIVHIENGGVYVNGVKLEEEYALKDDYSGDFTVPENSYFVMGDNRGSSIDARYWENHYVDKKDILGKAIFRFYPKLSHLY